MNSFKNLHTQYTAHKHAIQQLTGSIASDQLLLRLLQGLKAHVEKLENCPDTKYSAFVTKLDYTIDQRTLDRAIRTRLEEEHAAEEEEWLRKQNGEDHETAEQDPWPGYWDEGSTDSDGKHHAPYT